MKTVTGDSRPPPSNGSPSPDSTPWMAEDLLPAKSLGGETGLWRGKSEPMPFAEIEAHLRNQKIDEKAPIHWVEVPGSPRVVHVSEIPELRDALTERDLRHARRTLRRDRVLVPLLAVASVALLGLEVSQTPIFVLLMFGIQSAESWYAASDVIRRLQRDAADYFHRCTREARYAFWVHSTSDRALWRTWSLGVSWVALFIIQMAIGMDSSIQRAGLTKPEVWSGEVWRLITGPMLHGNLWHIFMNATSGISLALLVERTANRHVLLPLWLLGALGGSVFSLVLLPKATSVGASGGLMALVSFLLVLGWKRKHLLPPQFSSNILRSLGFMAAFGLLAWSVIDNAAHAGGALTGAIVGWCTVTRDEMGLPLPDTRRRTVFGWLGAAAYAVLVGFTIWCLLAGA